MLKYHQTIPLFNIELHRVRIELNKLEIKGKQNKILTYGLDSNFTELDSSLES
jgi:hypothetical protein